MFLIVLFKAAHSVPVTLQKLSSFPHVFPGISRKFFRITISKKRPSMGVFPLKDTICVWSVSNNV